MTPQERELVDDLFDRLTELENTPRDPDAERLIADGMRRAPHAVYALVQTALLQDEALKRANARIEALEAQLNGPEPQQQSGFLDNMRDTLFGRREPRGPQGSVPSVRPQAMPASAPLAPDRPQPGPQLPPYAPGPAFGGGSFLGTAASTAAGVLGGALLLDGIRSMFGHHGAAASPGTQTAFGGFGDRSADKGTAGSAADSDLARDAGIDHVGGHDRAAANDDDVQSPDTSDDWDTADADTVDAFDDDGGDFDGGDFDGGGSDFA